MTRRDDLIEHMARTLHLCAWADAAERDDETAELADPRYPDAVGLAQWRPDQDTCAGAGQDWNDTVPDGSSKLARMMAWIMVEKVERLNVATLEALADVYLVAGGPSDERFAHSLAMSCLGHGVTPADDVSVRAEYTNPKHGYHEFYYFDKEDAQ